MKQLKEIRKGLLWFTFLLSHSSKDGMVEQVFGSCDMLPQHLASLMEHEAEFRLEPDVVHPFKACHQ